MRDQLTSVEAVSGRRRRVRRARRRRSPGRLPALASELVAAGVRTILAVSPSAVRGPRHDVLTE